MTHKDDFIQLQTANFGRVHVSLSELDFDWPPPEFIVFDGEKMREATAEDKRSEIFHRERYSALTDDQIAQCSHVARGAEYKYVEQHEAL